MKSKRTGCFLLLILFLLPILSGCYNYKEINKVTFVTSMIFDKDAEDSVSVYLDCIKPYRDAGDSSDKGKRMLYKGKGKTVLEAIRDVNMATGYNLNLLQNRAYIFTERAATKGISQFIDVITKNQEFQIKPYMFVYYGDIDKLLEVTSKDDEYLGLLLNDMVLKNKYNPRSIATNINDYLTDNLTKGNVSLVGALELRKDVKEQRVELKGGVVFQGGKLIGKVDRYEGFGYNFLTNNIKSGTLEVPNPQTSDGYITLEILKSKTKTDVDYDGKSILVTKKINLDTTIGEAQGNFIVSSENLNKLRTNEESRLSEYLNETFNKYYGERIDILNVSRDLEIKYPKETIDLWDKEIKLKVIIDLDIEGTGKNKNSIQ
ncbi:MAG: Ger(x)C family spore germination protein [Clostridium sp.]